jgi:hypothetical protein
MPESNPFGILSKEQLHDVNAITFLGLEEEYEKMTTPSIKEHYLACMLALKKRLAEEALCLLPQESF